MRDPDALLALVQAMCRRPLAETVAQRAERHAHLLEYGGVLSAALRPLAEIDALRLDLKEQSERATEAVRRAGVKLHPRIAALRGLAEEASDGQ